MYLQIYSSNRFSYQWKIKMKLEIRKKASLGVGVGLDIGAPKHYIVKKSMASGIFK